MYQSELEFVGLLQPCLMDTGIPVITASFYSLISLLCLSYIHGGKPIFCLVQAPVLSAASGSLSTFVCSRFD